MLTVKECGGGTGLALVAARPFARVTVPVAAHAGELVVMEVGPRWTVGVTRHTAQKCVGIQHQALLALGALVCLRARAAHTGLMALCTVRKIIAVPVEDILTVTL